uniref:PLD phosphodiesterase domain-containing protein n=1 Tax=Setaria digitata TaxID=48799 RepID=A0A915PHU9_9BILA
MILITVIDIIPNLVTERLDVDSAAYCSASLILHLRLNFQTQDGRADMTNFEMDLFDTRINSYAVEKEESEQCCQHSIIKPACVPVSIISLFIFLIVFFPLFNEDGFDMASIRYDRSGYCTDHCRIQLVETIPSVLIFENSTVSNPSTYQVWKRLLDEARVSIDVASFYWNLRDSTAQPTSWQGNDTFNRFIAAAERGVRIRIAQNHPSATFPQLDSSYFFDYGYAKVRSLDMSRLIGDDGVLHTKFWIIDSRHIYIGSANMDWKSLTEVKELGVVIWNCTCTANDLYKIFNIYWRLGVKGGKIPYKWPLNLRTYFNFSHPLRLISAEDTNVFISSSPRRFSAKGREDDGDAIVAVMNNAYEFVHISVMDYMPTTLYRTSSNNTYWPKLDDAIRATVYRGVHVRLLVSHWKYSPLGMIYFLKSLLAINGGVPRTANHSGKIEVKLFTIPADPSHKEIPHTLVNHNKYMVTENIAYLGTSNWAGDYFINTAGVGISFISPALVRPSHTVFLTVKDFFELCDFTDRL